MTEKHIQNKAIHSSKLIPKFDEFSKLDKIIYLKINTYRYFDDQDTCINWYQY